MPRRHGNIHCAGTGTGRTGHGAVSPPLAKEVTLVSGLLNVTHAFLLCAVALVVSPLRAADEAPAAASVRSAAFDAIVERAVAAEQFRGVVLVAQHGKLLHRAAYGWADAENRRANTLATRFLIGSLTKSFTAIAVLQGVEQGKLDLHQPIGRYLPGLRRDLGEQLTLHHLLKHQSGLPTHLERLVEQAERPVSSAEMLTIINTSTLAFAPGSRYEYGNLGYHLAALVLESVSGRDYASVIQQQILAPSDMRDSGIERFGQRPPQRANGYAKTALWIRPDENNVSWAFGTGDIYSTADDLLKWDRALFSHVLLNPTNTARLFASESAERGSYGYGFRVQPYQRGHGHSTPGTLVRHGGSMDGFLANYHHYKEDELTVIVLGNIRPFDIRQLSFALKEAALGTTGLQRQRSATLE